MVKYGLAMLTLVGAVFAATASGSTASTATVRAAAGSCTGGAVAAVVNETFMCLTIGTPCAVANQDDYARFQLTCAAGKIAKLTSATVGAAPLADAFLNTGKNDFTTRAKTFKLGGSPPILHLTFKEALKGTHTVRVDLHNAKLDQILNFTLQSGWQFTYEVLPTASANSMRGAYRVSISIDGTAARQIYYSVA